MGYLPPAGDINGAINLLAALANPERSKEMLTELTAHSDRADEAERAAKAEHAKIREAIAEKKALDEALVRREADLALREKDLARERAALAADLEEMRDFQARVRKVAGSVAAPR
jgi:hypothetical protein